MTLRRKQISDPAMAELLAAARRPGTPEELAGLDDALAQFRLASSTTSKSRGRVWLAPKAVGAVGALLVLIGGTAAAAAAGALPAGLQRPAHDIFRAPAPQQHPRPSGSVQSAPPSSPSNGPSSTAGSTTSPTSPTISTSPTTTSTSPSDSTSPSLSPSNSTLNSSTQSGNPSPPGQLGKPSKTKKPLPTQANSHSSTSNKGGNGRGNGNGQGEDH